MFLDGVLKSQVVQCDMKVWYDAAQVVFAFFVIMMMTMIMITMVVVVMRLSLLLIMPV